MILDNTVVHDREKTVHGSMRVSVRVIRLPVGSPARMPHPDRGTRVFEFHVLFEVEHSSLAFVNSDVIVVNQRDPGRIVSPVFQAFQTID